MPIQQKEDLFEFTDNSNDVFEFTDEQPFEFTEPIESDSEPQKSFMDKLKETSLYQIAISPLTAIEDRMKAEQLRQLAYEKNSLRPDMEMINKSKELEMESAGIVAGLSPVGSVVKLGTKTIPKMGRGIISKEKNIASMEPSIAKDIIPAAEQVVTPEQKTLLQPIKDLSIKVKESLNSIKSTLETPKDTGVKSGIESMAQHHKSSRDVEFIASEIRKSFDDLRIPADRQELITNALEQPNKYLSKLTPVEKEIHDALKVVSSDLTQFSVETGLLTPAEVEKNYIFHWWKNPNTGKPYAPMYGRLSEEAPQLQARVHKTREEGIAFGEIPATSNPAELVEMSMISLSRAASSREMLKTLMNTEMEQGIIRKVGKETKEVPLKLIEGWSKLQKEGLTDGYERYFNPAINKIDPSGIGITKELYPYVRGYFENPTFGKAAQLNFMSKSLKLMSGFHIQSLGWQGLAGGKGLSRVPGYNVYKGLGQLKEGGDNLRLLYRNGLELKGFSDVNPNRGNVFQNLKESKNIVGKTIGKTLSVVQDLTFNVVHPGIKTNVSMTIFDNLIASGEKSAGRALTIAEKDTLAKEVVNYTNRLFSGEDYRSALLQTNQWMAKNFYSPEARKAWQTALISPQWQKAHIGMVADIAKSIFTKSGRAAPTAKLYRDYLYSALGIYAAANLYNFTMTKYMDGEGNAMIQNDGNNSFSVRAPWNEPDGRKVYLRPLKSIFEVPELLSDPIGKTINKLAPWIQASARQIRPTPFNKYEGAIGTGKRILDASVDLGVPMSAPSVFDKNKSTQSKISGVIGMPTSKSPKVKGYEYER